MNSVLLFLLGLTVGSFLNVLIYRLPKNLAITGRSFCPTCKRTIAWFDNMPLLSFVLRRGKCRYCHSPISLRYPLVELFTGALFVFAYLFPFQGRIMNQESGIMDTINRAYPLFIISSLIAIFFIDLKHGIIPDALVYPSVIISVVYFAIIHNSLFMIHLLSASGASLFFLFLFLVTRGRGMGLGDVKLAFLMGLVLGFPRIVASLYIAFLTGAVVSLIMVLLGKKTFGQTIAFGPFLVFATLFILFLYETIRSIFPWLYPY